MTESNPQLPATLTASRERVIEVLSRHYAHEHLDEEEFSARVDRVYRARTLQELEETHSDLPALKLPTPLGRVDEVGPGEPVRDRQLVLALLGGTERKGSWTPARQINAVAFMGGVSLDFRRARFAPGVTELSVVALMGGVEIIVPPGLRVECDGIGILGGFEGLDQEPVTGGEGEPRLLVRGLALMGGVEITERLPGETTREKKRRLRDERRRRLGHGD